MKKERLYYLDLIKILAVLAVFGCHFSRSLEFNGVGYGWQVLPDYIFNIYLGNFGVSLFFIISGAALMYVYDEKLEYGPYYKKRFLGIYPMFWMAFFIAFSLSLFRNGNLNPAIPKWKIIYSILGIDGNMLWWGANFYEIGEWFLSVIVLLYIIFPLLRIMLKKSIAVTVAVWGILYVLCVLFFKTTLPLDCFFVARVPELLFGMIFVKYIKKVGLLQLSLSSVFLIVMCLLPRTMITNQTVATTFVGIAAFSVLTWLFQHIPTTGLMKRLANICGKYCYPFFLTHHYVLRWVTSRFNGRYINKMEEIVIFIACFALVMLMSRILFDLHKAVMDVLLPPKTDKRVL